MKWRQSAAEDKDGERERLESIPMKRRSYLAKQGPHGRDRFVTAAF
jgi:hypothetical protein